MLEYFGPESSNGGFVCAGGECANVMVHSNADETAMDGWRHDMQGCYREEDELPIVNERIALSAFRDHASVNCKCISSNA